ncbi:MAG TPA: Plug domain-containing protein, partial [Acidobacteriaceae bacterium]
QVGQAVNFDIPLVVGAAKREEVTVQESSAATAIDVENSEVTTTVTSKEVQALQLNGRNATQLIALAPGVSNQTSQDEARVGLAGSVSYSVNGGRTEYNTFLVDGSDVLNVGINGSHTALIVTPSVDALQEIKVLTSNYSAQYPSSGSGTTVFTTRSGTDTYRGSIYEFNRNEAFNAKGYFDIGNHAPLYRRNDFGGTIGGPLSIPRLYDGKGKTHFFFSEEARLEKDPYAYRRGVPSLAERNGDFSDVCPIVGAGNLSNFNRTQYPDCPDAGLGNESNGAMPATFPSNQITYPNAFGPTPSLNQNAVAILNTGIFPLPTATSGCNSTGSSCYNAEVSLPTYWREELFRIDQTFGPSWQASFRYIHDEWDETTPVPQYAYTQNSFPTIQNRFYGPGRSLVARVTGAFSPTFLNELVLSYTDSNITLADVAPVGVSLARPAALDGSCAGPFVQCPMTEIFENQGKGLNGVPKLPGINIAGNNTVYGGFGFAADPGYTPWEHSNPTYTIADNLTKTLGRHNLQFGGDVQLYQRNQVNGPIGASTGDTQGILTFSNLRNSGSTGNSFADFLYTQLNGADQQFTPGGTGAISSFQQDSAQARFRQRYKIGEPYFQDDWKVSPRLTLNAGLRLSIFGNFYEANNQAYNWQASAFSAAAAATLAATGPYGNLQNAADGTPLTLNPAHPSAGIDPRILNGIVQCGTGSRPRGCASSHLFNPSP